MREFAEAYERFDRFIQLIEEGKEAQKLRNEISRKKSVLIYTLWMDGWTDGEIVAQLKTRGYSTVRQHIFQMKERGKRYVS